MKRAFATHMGMAVACATSVTPAWNRRCVRAFASFSTLVVAGTCAASAAAQAQEANIDPARGPITGSTRRIGLGGAFVAIADDSEGVAINPASDALRLPYSWDDWDYGLGIDVAVGAWLPKNDFYNRNQSGTDDTGKSTALFGSLAAVIYKGHGGLGISAEAQSNATNRPDRMQGIDTDLAANFGIVHASLAYGFLDGQLLLGAGPRFVGMSFDRHTVEGRLSTAGVGYEAGVIVKPIALQYRFAAAVKSPINATVGTDAAGGQTIAHVPWEVALGFAYQFGPRPLNPPFVTAKQVASDTTAGGEPTKADIERARDELFERYQRQQRRYVLISAELDLIQGDGDHLGAEQYLFDVDRASFSRPILSPRLGLETEVVRHVLKFRGGSYYEPARIDRGNARVHGTGGFDVRLFEWDVFGLVKPFDYWQLSVAADGARAYLNTSFSIGFWH
jgi:hypothetical protein